MPPTACLEDAISGHFTEKYDVTNDVVKTRRILRENAPGSARRLQYRLGQRFGAKDSQDSILGIAAQDFHVL